MERCSGCWGGGSQCYFSTAVIVVVIYSCPYYNGGSLLICALSLSNAHTHMYFRSIEKKSPRDSVTDEPVCRPCRVGCQENRKFSTFFFPLLFAARLFVVSLTRALYTLLHTPPTGREGIGVIKEKSNVFDTAAAESRCC